jgi:hypothetical protein
MGNRTRTLTFVRRLSGELWSESQFFNFSKSVRQVVSDSKFRFPFLKHRRYLLNVGLSSIRAEGALRVVRSHRDRRSH